MNRIVLAFATLAASICLIVACKKDDPEPEKGNQAPTLSILKPEDGISYGIDGADTTFAIEVNASDSDGSIAKVEFYIDGSKIGEDNTSPYSYTYTFTPNIEYTIKSKAIDDDGSESSKEFAVVVAIPN